MPLASADPFGGVIITGTNNDWTDSAVADDTATKLEDAILTRARQLRVAELDE